MGRHRLSRPWLTSLVVLGLLAATLVLGLLNHDLAAGGSFISIAFVTIIGYAVVGALIATRVPENPTGRLMIAIAASFVAAGIAAEYATRALETAPGSLPLGTAVAWFSNWSFIAVPSLIALFVLVFPTGHVPSPRWRPLPITIVSLAVLAMVLTSIRTGTIDVGAGSIANPTAIESLRRVLDVLGRVVALALVVASLMAVVPLVLRYARSSGEERQQVRWLAYAVAVAGICFAAALVTSLVQHNTDTGVVYILFTVFLALLGIGVPVATGIAILRFRLYDLDLVIKKTVVFVIVAGLLTAVGVLTILAVGGRVIRPNRTDTGALLLIGVALGFLIAPLYRRASKLADRIVYGGRATPYEVLAEFSDRMAETYSTDDVLLRMAGVLGAGIRAERVVVWLRVGGELRPAAAWPETANAPTPRPMGGDHLPMIEGEHHAEVRHQGELLGAVSVTMPASDPMSPSRNRLMQDLAAQAGLVLRNVRLIQELRASRQRIVAAQDLARRRLERDIHDGAQQQLVALSIKLRLADGMVNSDPSKAHEVLAQLQGETVETLETLRDLARGIYPPLLADKGLAAALEAQARKAAIPVTVQQDGVGRWPEDVEAAVYFCSLEALQNAAKYAEASAVTIALGRSDNDLTFEVRDDGRGFDRNRVSHGTGLQGMADRLDAIGGTLQIVSAPGAGTTVTGRVPLNTEREGS